MSSPKTPGPKSTAQRTAREAINRGQAAQRPRPDTPPKQNAKRASAEAKLVAAAIQRGIADGQLDVLSADALQALIAAACKLYTARREGGEDCAGAEECDLRHRRDGDCERPSSRRRSRRVRTRHVAGLDGR